MTAKARAVATGRAAGHIAVPMLKRGEPSGIRRDAHRPPQAAVHSTAGMLQLQRTAGNRAVSSVAIQRLVPADPTAPKTVRIGSNGPAIEELQQHLNRHGATPALVIDGVFGSKTQAAAKAFQIQHKLGPDGIVGPLTWRALQAAVASALPTGATEHPRDEAVKIFAKGAAMTPAEATRAQALLMSLEGDEFRSVIKGAIASGAFQAMLLKLDLATLLGTLTQLTQEVVVPTTLLKPATDTIDADFTRANELYKPQGIEIERGVHIDLSEKATRQLLGGNTDLDEFTGDKATKEELKLIEINRSKGRIAGYWVPTMTSSRGEAVLKSDLKNLGEDRESVVVDTSKRAQDTFPHELGHALGLPHDPAADPNNLMAEGKIRNTTGAGIDKLTDAQVAILRASIFAEVGRKGVGK